MPINKVMLKIQIKILEIKVHTIQRYQIQIQKNQNQLILGLNNQIN